MFVKAGAAMMALALGFAAVVGLYAFLDEPMEPAAAAKAATEVPVESPVRSDSSVEPWVEPRLPEPKVKAAEAEPEPKPQTTEKLPDLVPSTEPTPAPAEPREEPEPRPGPVPEHDGPVPTGNGLDTDGYDLPAGAVMGLTVEAMGLRNVPVFDSDGSWAMKNGVGHVPETSMPWTDAPQRNVFVAGHRLGFPGTESDRVFWDLDELREGDEISLRDRDGKAYKYRVSETFIVGPMDSWVMGQVRKRDMLTLQTCTPIPSYEKRLIVRADRV